MDTIDEIGRRAGHAARADAETVTDVEGGLARIKAAVERPRRGGGRPWAVLGAAAAVVAAVAGAVVVSRDEPSSRIVPATTPDTTSSETVPANTAPSEEPTTTAMAPTTTTTVTTAPSSPPSGLAVSFLAPPPELPVEAFATIAVTDGFNQFSGAAVAVDGDVIVLDRAAASALIVAPDGTTTTVPLDAVPFAPVGGPEDILYGIVNDEQAVQQPAFAVVAIPLSGERAGRVVASSPVDAGRYTELPAGALGLGPTGVVDRSRYPGTELLAYVDAAGGPLSWPDAPPLVSIDAEHTVRSSAGTEWPLTVERHPEWPEPYAGDSPPSPAAGGGAVYWTSIGPPTAETAGTDYPDATIPVVAVMTPDGSAQWYQVPDGWSVVAADVGGTILARADGERVELARLGARPEQPVDPASSGASHGFAVSRPRRTR